MPGYAQTWIAAQCGTRNAFGLHRHRESLLPIILSFAETARRKRAYPGSPD
jgi:hypothetical protein